MPPVPSRRHILEFLFWTVAIAALFWLGRHFFTFQKSYLGFTTSVLWPMSGIGMGLLIVRGWGFFPAIFLGRVLSTEHLWLRAAPFEAKSQYMGDVWVHPAAYTAVALAGCFLFTRVLRLSKGLQHLGDLLPFLTVVAPLSSLLFPSIGSLAVTEFFTIKPENFFFRFLLSWSGNYLGILVFVPLVLVLHNNRLFREVVNKRIPSFFLFLGLGASLLPLCQHFDVSTSYPLAFLPFPILVWISLSLGFPATVLAGALITLTLTRLTILELGPLFPGNSPLEAFLQLTMYVGLLSSSSMIISCIMDERRMSFKKKEMMITTANMSLWEWSAHQGVVLLDQHIPLFVTERGRKKSVSTATWKRHFSEEDFQRLPWINRQPNATLGEESVTEIKYLQEGSPGRTLEMTCRITAIDSRGRPSSLLGTIRDITDQKKQEETNLMALRQAMEFENLQTKLNPHFLFNSLNLLKSLIAEDPEKARSAVLSLSEILRSSLRKETDAPLSTLGKEIALCRSYLELQQLRFGTRLTARVEVSPGTPDMLPLPPLMLTQLVENAVKHGIEPSSSGGLIEIDVGCDGGLILIRVTSPGEYTQGATDGIGLAFIRKQLDIRFGQQAAFTIDNGPNRTVLAEIRIPMAADLRPHG